MTQANAKVHIVPAGGGEAHWFTGCVWTYKARGPQTDGAYAVVELRVPPKRGMFGSPHAHPHEVKSIYVLEGTMTLLLGDEEVDAGPGAFAAIPRGVVHGFSNNGATEAKALVIYSPAGFEQFIADAGEPAQHGGFPPDTSGPPADRTKLRAARAKFAIDSHAPPEWR